MDVLGGRRWGMLHGEALRLLRELPDACIDAVITDEPYSSGGFTRGDRSVPVSTKYVMTGTQLERPDFAGDNRDQRSFGYWCALWLSESLRVAKPGSPICMFSDWRQLPTVTDALQAGGWVWRGIVPWDKEDSARPSKGRFAAQCEYVVWGTAGPALDLEEIGCLRGCIRCAVEKDKIHITQKPKRVMCELAAICPPNGIILDPFAGSGSTGVGALNRGRRFLGFEVILQHVLDARDRLLAEEQDSTLQAIRESSYFCSLPLKEGRKLMTKKKGTTNGRPTSGSKKSASKADRDERSIGQEKVDVAFTIDAAAAAQKGRELAKLTIEARELREERREDNARFREKRVALDEQIDKLSQNVEEHTELRPVLCDLVFVTQSNEVKITRRDTGEVIQTRAATAAERQLDLFGVPKGKRSKRTRGSPAATVS